MKKISLASEFSRAKTGSYEYVLLDKQNELNFEKWSNSLDNLTAEKSRITELNPSLGNRLIIVKTIIDNFYNNK